MMAETPLAFWYRHGAAHLRGAEAAWSVARRILLGEAAIADTRSQPPDDVITVRPRREKLDEATLAPTSAW
jgi:hypothetical protein